MDIGRLKREVQKLAADEGKAPPSTPEFEYFSTYDLWGVSDDEMADFVWARVKEHRLAKEAIDGTSGSRSDRVSTYREKDDGPALGSIAESPAWWTARSSQLWENYHSLQEAALTIIGRSEPLRLGEVEPFLTSLSEQETKSGEQVVLVYPRESDGVFIGELLFVYRGAGAENDRARSQSLSRIADLARHIADDLQCDEFHAVAFLLCDVKPDLPWVSVKVRTRKWSVGEEQLGIAGVPDRPRFPLGDEATFLRIVVGGLYVPQKDVARVYGQARREALLRFSGKSPAEVLGELVSGGPLTSQVGEGERAGRPRAGHAKTHQLIEFVETRRAKKMPWDEIFKEWKRTGSAPPFKSRRSLQNTFYRARGRVTTHEH